MLYSGSFTTKSLPGPVLHDILYALDQTKISLTLDHSCIVYCEMNKHTWSTVVLYYWFETAVYTYLQEMRTAFSGKALPCCQCQTMTVCVYHFFVWRRKALSATHQSLPTTRTIWPHSLLRSDNHQGGYYYQCFLLSVAAEVTTGCH